MTKEYITISRVNHLGEETHVHGTIETHNDGTFWATDNHREEYITWVGGPFENHILAHDALMYIMGTMLYSE